MPRDLSLFMVYYSLEGEYNQAINKARVLTGPLYCHIKYLRETGAPANEIIETMEEISRRNRRFGEYSILRRQGRLLKILKSEGCL